MRRTLMIAMFMFFCFSSLFSAVDCHCKCYKPQPDAGDYINRGLVFTEIIVLPLAYNNYMMYKDGNGWMIYVSDVFVAATVASMFVFEDKSIAGGMSVASAMIPWIYSTGSLISGYINRNKDGIARGWTGLGVCFLGFASGLFSFRCSCAAEKDCVTMLPVVGGDYAGLDCKFSF